MIKTPPLNALRAFEAAARSGSFVAAGRELGVSSAAISQQVKLLEEVWQQSLFIRQGNRLFLTDAGQSAYPQLAQAMGNIVALSDRMQSKEARTRRMVLSVPHSVAETWLASRLAAAPGPGWPIDIRIDDDPIDFVQDRIDLRIFFGHDLYGDYQVDTLFTDSFIAVARADLANRWAFDLMQVPDTHLIHTNWGRGFASSPKWEAVFQGRRSVDRDVGLSVRSSSTALNFARHGHGLALVPSAIARSDIEAGHLCTFDAPPLQMSGAYRIAYPKRLKSHRVVRSLIKALAGSATTPPIM